jgi:hypothetical protein
MNSSSSEIDRIPVAQLMSHYALARSAVYTRLNALGIEPEKIGGKAYLNGPQLELMDQLHAFIKQGGNTAEFLEMKGLPPMGADRSDRSDRADRRSTAAADLSSGQSSGLAATGMGPLVTALAAAIAAAMSKNQPPTDPFAYYKLLEQAARTNWLLKTSEVAKLLDLSSAEVLAFGDRFTDAGFVFTHAGYRANGEVAWTVSKLPLNPLN